MRPPSPSQAALAALIVASLLISSAVFAQQSARETFEAEQIRLGLGDRLGQWSQWQYHSATLSEAAGLDFNMAWGYVDAATASEGDAFIAVVTNRSEHTYCLRPRLHFKGEVFQVQAVTTSVALAPGESLRIAELRVARRSKLKHDINAAFWPAPAGSETGRCSAQEPPGLAGWLGRTGDAPFPGNRVRPPVRSH